MQAEPGNPDRRVPGIQPPRSFGSVLPKFLMASGVAILILVGLYAKDLATPSGSSTAKAAPHTPFVVNLTITPGAGPTGTWPAWVPSTIKVPAHSLVVIRVVNLDNATSIPEPFNTVKGTVGGVESIAPLDLGNPNRPRAAKVVSSLKRSDVAHTFTILSLGVSVPILPVSVTTFTIRTGGPGTYAWRCFDPCGAGTTGWNGAMATEGFMKGFFQVT